MGFFDIFKKKKKEEVQAVATAEIVVETGDCAVVLIDIGRNKLGVVKIVRDYTGLGLAEAKNKVEALDAIATNFSKERAEKLAAELKTAGATAEVVETESAPPAI